jgi:Ring finger domain
MDAINLLPHQLEHVRKMKQLLRTNHFALDFSALGSGKTYSAAKIAEEFDYVLVIAPTTVGIKWKQICQDYSIFSTKNVRIMTFAGIRNVKSIHNGNNNILSVTREIKNKAEVWVYHKTKQFQEICEQWSVLVIVDEIQNIKNDTAQYHAVKEILRGFKDSPNNKFIGISGSPIDKIEQVPRLLELVEFVSEPFKWYDHSTKTMYFPGVIQFKKKLGVNTVKYLTKNTYQKEIWDVFVQYFKPRFSFEMSFSDLDNPSKLSICNGYYDFDEKSTCETFKWVHKLNTLMVFKKKQGNAIEFMSQITTVLMNLEYSKVANAIKIAVTRMKSNPNEKILLLFNYTKSIAASFKWLSKRYPGQVITISGKTKNRKELLSVFSEPNNNVRILIGQVAVLSTGIDLDDKDGRFPRFALVSPNFKSIELYQLTKRFKRADTRSDSTIHFLYCNGIPSEEKILKSLSTKSKVMSEITDIQTQKGEKYIGDLVEYYESDFEQRNKMFKDLLEKVLDEDENKFQDQNDLCSICLEQLESNSKVLSCGHVYHDKCILDWIIESKSTNCPTCRASF